MSEHQPGVEARPLNQEQIRELLQRQIDSGIPITWHGGGGNARGLTGEATPEQLSEMYGVVVRPAAQGSPVVAQPAQQTAGPVLVQIGNITANSHWIVTPAGTWPVASINVTSVDQTATTTHTPAWAIVLVVLFIWFFFLSLLFLLARESRVTGYIAIHIAASNGQGYTEQVPVHDAQQRADILNRVGYLQSLIGQARATHNL